MKRSYVVPMRWMVIREYEVPGGSLNVTSTKLPRPWSPWETSASRKNPHDRTGNRPRDLMISRQKLWPLDHDAGPAFDVIFLILKSMTCAVLCFTTPGLVIGCDTYFLVQPVLNDSESCLTQSHTLQWKRRCFRGKNSLHKETYVSKRT
jgi:hypothetical protein